MQSLHLKNISRGTLYAASNQMRAAKKANRSDLAANVRALMKRRDWTQLQLADKAGISQTHVGNILREENDASISVLAAIGQAFGVPGWQLLVPNLPPDLLDSPELPTVVERYATFRQSNPTPRRGS
jgi:transcriptional regulator with XRE-family HTH domain